MVLAELTHISRRPVPIDVLVGHNVRKRRLTRGLSQTQLAEPLDLTFQQIQKYEKGINRISAGVLYELAKILGCSIEQLYEGVDTLPAGEIDTIFSVGRVDRLDYEVARAVLALPEGKKRALLQFITATSDP
jgi:transcriptional regulator with XRE-family HTH domain